MVNMSPRGVMDSVIAFEAIGEGSNPSGGTIWEIAKSLGAALATPPPDASATKGKFKSAESRRKKRMKKNAKILKNYY